MKGKDNHRSGPPCRLPGGCGRGPPAPSPLSPAGDDMTIMRRDNEERPLEDPPPPNQPTGWLVQLGHEAKPPFPEYFQGRGGGVVNSPTLRLLINLKTKKLPKGKKCPPSCIKRGIYPGTKDCLGKGVSEGQNSPPSLCLGFQRV